MGTSRGRPLRFTRIRLENWRNFLSVDAAVTGRVFLVGPNASGKSNFLDALRFLQDIAAVGGGLQAAVQRPARGGVSRLRCLAARRYPDVGIGVDVGDESAPRHWTYELRFNQDNRQRPIVVEERVLRQGELLLARPNKEDEQDRERRTQTALEQVTANREFREVAEFLTGLRYLHLVPQLVREPDRSIGRKNDPYGGDFLEQVVRTPERTKKARLRKILDALRVAVPQLQSLEDYRDESNGTPHLRGKYEHWRPQGAWQSEEQFSDGTLRLLGLLWALLDGAGPLLLEEPELSLHPEVVHFLPQMLARLRRASGRQVLLSTHSTDLLRDQGIGLDEVLLLTPGSEGTSIRPASALKEARSLLDGGLSMADVVVPHTRPPDARQLSLFGE
jgi:predicted ATPase